MVVEVGVVCVDDFGTVEVVGLDPEVDLGEYEDRDQHEGEEDDEGAQDGGPAAAPTPPP